MLTADKFHLPFVVGVIKHALAILQLIPQKASVCSCNIYFLSVAL
jgi:hypothetical protein